MTQFSTSTWMQHTFVNLCEKCLKTAHAQTKAHHLTIKLQTFVHQWSLLQVLLTEGFQICFCNVTSNVCRSEHIFVNTHNYPQITHIWGWVLSVRQPVYNYKRRQLGLPGISLSQCTHSLPSLVLFHRNPKHVFVYLPKQTNSEQLRLSWRRSLFLYIQKLMGLVT